MLRFLDFVTDNSPGKPFVDVKRFLARDRMFPNDRVLLHTIESFFARHYGIHIETNLCLDWLPSDRSSTGARVVSLSNSRMDRTKTLKTFLKFRRETIVRFDLRAEEGIASSGRLI